MGNDHPKPKRNKKVRAETKRNIHQATQCAVKDIEIRQEKLCEAVANSAAKNEPEKISLSQYSEIYQLSEVAKRQVSRGGGNFTKADYIAILARLEPENAANVQYLWNNNTIEELRTAIRLIIYRVGSENAAMRIAAQKHANLAIASAPRRGRG